MESADRLPAFVSRRSAAGRILFHAPTGDNLSAQRQATRISKHADVIRWLDRYMPELEIDPETCVPCWYAGDRMDWDMAVSGMFQ